MASSSSSSSSAKSHPKLETKYKSLTAFVQHCVKLRNVETFGKLDPYVIIKLGKKEMKSEVFRDAGVNPHINTQFHMPFEGETYLTIIVKDKKRLGRDREVGREVLKLAELQTSATTQKLVQLHHGSKQAPAGHVQISLKFSRQPTANSSVTKFTSIEKTKEKTKEGSSSSSSSSSLFDKTITESHKYRTLRLTVFRAHKLRNVATVGKIDPYVSVRLGKEVIRCEAVRDGGLDPQFNTSFVIPYHNQRHLKISVFDAERVAKDRPVGSVKLDLQSFVSRALAGGRTDRMSLALKGSKGEAGGLLLCRVAFEEVAVERAAVLKHEPAKKAKASKATGSASSSSSSSSSS